MEAESGAAITSTVQTAGTDARVTAYGWKALAGIGDRLFHGRVRPLNSQLHAYGHPGAPLLDKHPSRLPHHVDVGRRRGGLIFGTLSDHFGYHRYRVLDSGAQRPGTHLRSAPEKVETMQVSITNSAAMFPSELPPVGVRAVRRVAYRLLPFVLSTSLTTLTGSTLPLPTSG